MTDPGIDKLIKFFGKSSFSKRELSAFYKMQEPDLKDGTLGWRIYDLKSKGIIQSVKRGVYSLSHQKAYTPEFSSSALKIAKKISKAFAGAEYCIWETSWLNEFSIHQTIQSYILVEIEPGLEQSLYYYLKDSFRYDHYLTPDLKVFDLYVSESKLPVIIEKLISRSPIEKSIVKGTSIPMPRIEKILADLFVNKKGIFDYLSSELVPIYENALKRYTINLTTLLGYAERRKRGSELKEFLRQNFQYILKDIL